MEGMPKDVEDEQPWSGFAKGQQCIRVYMAWIGCIEGVIPAIAMQYGSTKHLQLIMHGSVATPYLSHGGGTKKSKAPFPTGVMETSAAILLK